MQNIVILGGAYAGISTAHRILKQAANTAPFKITLVAPNTHLYSSMSSPRGIIPGSFADEKLFLPIATGFAQYPADRFEFIVGTAETLDVDAKNVEISSSTGTKMLDYDFLILATGSRTGEHTPFKSLGSTEDTKATLHEFQAQVKNSSTIVVAGAGITGVEVAGELGFEYGQRKKVYLVASGATILEESSPSVLKYSIKELQKLNVHIKLQTKVIKSTRTSDSRQELVFSDGEKLVADMYIPTFGLIPNSSYIPKRFLNASGHVIVDEFLKIKGAQDIWAIGDVSDTEWSQFVSMARQSTYAAKHITLLLSNKTPVPYKPMTSRFFGLQIGKNAGTGQYGNFKLPTFVVVWARKNLFVDGMEALVNGSAV